MKKIKIYFRNGGMDHWKKKQWNDYKYDGKYFIVMKNGAWVGFYNLDDVMAIIIE